MSVENHYTKKLEQLKGPRATSDFIILAKGLFDAASGESDRDSGFVIPEPTYFSDTSEATRVYWRNEKEDHDFFQVHLIGRSVLFTLQSHHVEVTDDDQDTEKQDEVDEPDPHVRSGSGYIDNANITLAVGSQPSRLFANDGIRPLPSRDAIRGRETNTPWFRESGRDILLPAFRSRLDHTMATIGIHETIPEEILELLPLRELLLAS